MTQTGLEKVAERLKRELIDGPIDIGGLTEEMYLWFQNQFPRDDYHVEGFPGRNNEGYALHIRRR